MPSDYANQRTHERKTVVFKTKIVVGGVGVNCEITNISSGGAQIHVPMDAPAGSDVTLKIAQLCDFKARVVWCRKKNMGLRFDDDPERIAQAMMMIATYGGG